MMFRALCLFFFAVCVRAEEDLRKFAYEKAEMGLPFQIVLYARDEASAKSAADAAFARIEKLNRVFSDYDPESELSLLSRSSGQGRAVAVSPDLWLVLERAQALARRTDGAFDITAGPLINLWRRVRRKRELPSPDLLAEMKTRVGWRHLQLDPQAKSATLALPEMRLDCGAIAKGYAIDEALRTLRERGITRALVSGGGDMAAGDAPPGEEGWKVEVAPLDSGDEMKAEVILLCQNAMATSGDVFQYVEISGARYSHIVDPKTGVGLVDHSLVTIFAPDGLTADSLSTAVSVLGPAKGLALIEETPLAAGRIVRKPAAQIEVHYSQRWSHR